jgi:hypothetical protein
MSISDKGLPVALWKTNIPPPLGPTVIGEPAFVISVASPPSAISISGSNGRKGTGDALAGAITIGKRTRSPDTNRIMHVRENYDIKCDMNFSNSRIPKKEECCFSFC